MKHLFPLVFCLALTGLACAHDAKRLEAVSFKRHARLPGLRVSYQSLAPHHLAHGVPVATLTFVNEEPVRRTLRVRYEHEGTVERSLVLEPSSTVSAEFVEPLCAGEDHTDCARICVQEKGQDADPVSVGYADSRFLGSYQVSHEPEVNVLVGASVDAIATAADYSHADEEEGQGPGASATVVPKRKKPAYSASGEKGGFHFYTQALGPDGWSGDTRAYSGYDLVLLADEEWNRLPAGARRALVGYAVQGGTLILCGRAELPEEACGFPVGASVPEKEARVVGYGRILLAPALGADRRPPLPRDELCKLAKASCERLREHFGRNANLSGLIKDVPATEIPSAPVSLFVALLVVFALGVVPGVLCYCIFHRRRMAAFIILPVVSGGIGLVVVLGILGFYGITPYLDQKSVVLLNAADRRASVRTRSFLITPVDVVDRLRFSRAAQIVKADYERRSYGYEQDRNYVLLPGDEMRAQGTAWLKTMKPHAYVTSEMRDTNARLEVEELGADKVRVTNLLGAEVDSLTVVDSRGLSFATENLSDGAARELTPDKETFEALWPKDFRPLRSCYRARLESCPFATDTLGGTRAKRTSETVVYGAYGKGVAK